MKDIIKLTGIMKTEMVMYNMLSHHSNNGVSPTGYANTIQKV